MKTKETRTLDISEPKCIEVLIASEGDRLWVNVEGQKIEMPIVINDDRSKQHRVT